MKVAKSDGGPFIVLALNLKHRWSGIAGKRFIGERSPFPNDYEAAGSVVLRKPPRDIAKLSSEWGDALFLNMPFETTIVEADGRSASIAQVHYADEDWSFSRLSRADFEGVRYDEHIPFSSDGSGLVIFDAAYPAEDVGDDFVSFELPPGDHVLSAGFYYPDSRTLCTLYKVTKA